MKNQTLRCKPASIAKTRWAAYAAAGAATALAGSNSAEAAIHYSGILDVPFPDNSRICYYFPLDKPGVSCALCHSIYTSNLDFGRFFLPFGIATAAFRGYGAPGGYYVSQLHLGRRISTGPFVGAPQFNYGGIFPHHRYGGGRGDWKKGSGFIGFRFNTGAGVQYGWVRIRVLSIGTCCPTNYSFIMHDYAYADPGEPLRAGEISSDNGAVEENSLGGLALGAVGLLVWRKSRSRTLGASPFQNETANDSKSLA
jgi:hypothetical protein